MGTKRRRKTHTKDAEGGTKKGVQKSGSLGYGSHLIFIMLISVLHYTFSMGWGQWLVIYKNTIVVAR